MTNRRLSLRFAWYDMWVGAFYDRQRHVLYVCPLPCILITYRFPEADWYDSAAPLSASTAQAGERDV